MADIFVLIETNSITMNISEIGVRTEGKEKVAVFITVVTFMSEIGKMEGDMVKEYICLAKERDTKGSGLMI